MSVVVIRHGHFYCGLGAGAEGFNQGHARVGQMEARFECVGGIDSDPAACRDFERRVGVRATLLDLFSLEQYIAYHGHPPPDGWRPAVPADIHRAFHYKRPHIIFLSAPCKGFSGLLSEAASRGAKYQALNALTLRGIWLMLEAYKDDPVELIVFENVPRIQNRGRPLLDKIVALLEEYGYAVAETTHDCGELGNLAQSRKRFLLVARHVEKVPPFLYVPPKHALRGVGEVLEKFPLPGPEPVLPMHRLPSLQWKTWVRLAFVEAGSDWRSLNRLNVEDGLLTDYRIAPDLNWNRGVLGVREWWEPAVTLSGRSGPTNGAYSIADPRIDGHPKSVQHGVRRWVDPAAVVTGKMYIGGGPHAVADPRYKVKSDFHALRVVPWQSQTGTITAARSPGSSASSVADPRISGKPRFNNVYRIVEWDKPSRSVTGSGGPAGGAAVADPRPGKPADELHGKHHITHWDAPSRAVISGRENGASVVADPRAAGGFGGKGKYRVAHFDSPAGTVIAASTTGQGAFAVADPRPVGLGKRSGKSRRSDHYGVIKWSSSSGAVTSNPHPWDNGRGAVADPRSGISDEAYKTQGQYGVLPWGQASGSVTGKAKLDTGRWSVADPRTISFETTYVEPEVIELPEPNQKLVCMIRALDGTWHRPFTTLELAALQGLIDPDEILELDGLSDSAWRERIGNAVPPPAAKAIADVMGRTLLLAWSGETFTLSNEDIWVRDVAVALSVDQEVRL